jgi:membrane protease YdiL (CAAX protease family)
MSFFQEYALLLTGFWLALVALWFQRSTPVLIGGLVLVAAFVAAALDTGLVSLAELGLDPNAPPLPTLVFAVSWLAPMLAASPGADWIASRLIAKPPTLGAFRPIQRSWIHLAAGILVAWILGGFLEELVFRGIVLLSIESMALPVLGKVAAAALAILVAALGAGIIHLYQGPRAALIIAQLSVLFGVLFVISDHNLWAVILCHGLYDTVAFIRFAAGKSKYSKLDDQGGAQAV